LKPFLQDNPDLLQNIEFSIVEAYRRNPAVTDFDVTDALDAITRQYGAEMAGRDPSTIPLDPRAMDVYTNARTICEWRLGRSTAASPVTTVTLEETVAALRTIMKSVRRWSGRGGKRGYLDFVKNYLP